MSRDRLAPLLRLRELEVAAARRDLTERRERAALAERHAQSARDAISAELQGGIEFADSLVAWLPLARAARDRAAGDARLAEQAVEVARAGLAADRARARAVELVIERRATEARLRAARRDQAAIDEAAQRIG